MILLQKTIFLKLGEFLLPVYKNRHDKNEFNAEGC
jgi:hypothetical protein